MYACVGRWAVWERVRRWHGPGGWRLGRGRRPRRSPAGGDGASVGTCNIPIQEPLAKRGENSRFAKAMRSEGDESGIASGKRKERVIFREAMKSWARAGCEVILSTQRILRGCDLILSTQRILRGGDWIFYLHQEIGSET